MLRLLAAALLVFVALGFSSAQENDGMVRVPLGRSHLPFDVVQHEGKTAWRVSGRGRVSVEDLVGGLASATGTRVSFTATAAAQARTAVPWFAPDSGTIIANENLLEFVNDVLAAGRLAVVGSSAGRGTLAGYDEAAAYAPFVALEQLPDLPAGEWATVTRTTSYADRDTVREALPPAVAQGVVTLGVQGSHLIVTGPVAQVRKLLAVVDAVDTPGAGPGGEMVRSHELPQGVQAQQAVGVLMTLFREDGTTITDMEGRYRVTEGGYQRIRIVAFGERRVLVRGDAASQAMVAAAIEAMR
jgi:hypothetical protein